MADFVKRMRGGGGKESHRERLAREHREEKAKRAAQKAIAASKPGPKGWEKVGRAIVSARDKALEHPVGQAAVLLAGRGRGRALPKGMGAKGWKPKKLPKWEPAKVNRGKLKPTSGERIKHVAKRQRAGELPSYEKGPSYKLKKAKASGPKRPNKKVRYSKSEGRSTPATRMLEKERVKAARMPEAGYGAGKTKAGRRVTRAQDKLTAQIAKRKKGKTFKLDKTPVGQGHGYGPKKAKAPAKGKRTKMTSRRKVSLPSMGLKPRMKPSRPPGQGRIDYFRRETPRSAARTLQREKDWLGSVKEIKSKRQRKERRTLSQNPSSDRMYSNPILRQRKDVLKAKKVKDKVDRGERVWTKKAYDFRLKDWPGDPRLGKMQHKPTRQAKSGAEKPKATGQKDQARFEGQAHIKGPKVKIPKEAQVKKDSRKRPPKGQSKRMKAGSKRQIKHETRKADMSTDFQDFLADIKSKPISRSEVLKAIKKRPSLTKAQKAVLLATAATAIAAEKKRRTAKPKKSGWPQSGKLPKREKVTPTKKFAIDEKPVRFIKRKETAAEKNKRLNIRFKARPKADPKRGLKPGEMRGTKAQRKRTLEATKRKRAGQRQAEKYPPKEK